MGTHPIFESDFDCLTEMDLSGVGDFLGQNRNIVSTITSSFFFFTGWLIAIDSAVRCNISEFPDLQYLDAYHTCGVFATLSFLLINSVSNSRLDDDFYEGGLCGGCGAKVWLFMGFMCSFGSVIASLWILFGAYVTNGPDIPDGSDALKYCPSSSYPGIAIFLQNFFILISTMVFKFGRSHDD